MLKALVLAFHQLFDPAFRKPVLLGAAGALAGLLAIGALASWALGDIAAGTGWFAGVAAAAGGVLVLFAAWWLFVPLLLAVSGLFLDGVAAAVERRHYPALPAATGATATSQAWAGLVLAAKMAGLTLVLLPLSLLLPMIGTLGLWAVAAIGLGEGLFEGVALRRMDRGAAEALRRRRRGAIWTLGGALAAMAAVPVLNLLVPVLGTAAMTHLLHRSDVSSKPTDSRG
ncbi:EI24 domain-containing protein [Falsiroseomonas stagni]|uniref:Etoposide-induced protein 2.4 (EI24) n=1 Tax=Falsiroseomonas stagni DSM 19981 TaxID=1123062 RepID=A0A1I4A249_9PROT|nr:EI24 domain-containing protein [Falsiroseomonas stagni]SFK50021.1 Etoposide-induced protein 2.4 (EI24) [Falsiroseomonas stagni DSM 19981]